MSLVQTTRVALPHRAQVLTTRSFSKRETPRVRENSYDRIAKPCSFAVFFVGWCWGNITVVVSYQRLLDGPVFLDCQHIWYRRLQSRSSPSNNEKPQPSTKIPSYCSSAECLIPAYYLVLPSTAKSTYRQQKRPKIGGSAPSEAAKNTKIPLPNITRISCRQLLRG